MSTKLQSLILAMDAYAERPGGNASRANRIASLTQGIASEQAVAFLNAVSHRADAGTIAAARAALLLGVVGALDE